MSKTFPCKKHFPGSAPGGYLWGTTDDVVHVREEDLATLIAASHGDIYEVPADEAEAEVAEDETVAEVTEDIAVFSEPLVGNDLSEATEVANVVKAPARKAAAKKAAATKTTASE